MSKYGLFSLNKDSFIMEIDESIEIADLHMRFNAYRPTINAEGEEQEEIMEDEQVDDRSVQPFDVDSNCVKFFPVIFWHQNFLFACRCR